VSDLFAPIIQARPVAVVRKQKARHPDNGSRAAGLKLSWSYPPPRNDLRSLSLGLRSAQKSALSWGRLGYVATNITGGKSVKTKKIYQNLIERRVKGCHLLSNFFQLTPRYKRC
jgi:hypothetical protein